MFVCVLWILFECGGVCVIGVKCEVSGFVGELFRFDVAYEFSRSILLGCIVIFIDVMMYV